MSCTWDMGVSKNRGTETPKWMVKRMENPIKIHDFWGTTFLETPICLYICLRCLDFIIHLWFDSGICHKCKMLDSIHRIYIFV